MPRLPTLLQTSPYLTLIAPGQKAPIVYATTDTRGIEYPIISDPGDAQFGVIDLDRRVIWHSSSVALRALQEAAPGPLKTKDLIRRFGFDTICDLAAREWIQDPKNLCREYRLYTGQIEITSHCNWRCKFCPVSLDPKPHEVMPMDLFTEIVEKLAEVKTLRFVTFHFFNEPTLDPNFAARIHILARFGLKLSLSTNCSGLTRSKIELLSESGVLHHLVVNMPSVDEHEFSRMTGSRSYRVAKRNLQSAIEVLTPITITVNGKGDSLARNVAELTSTYGAQGVEVRPTLTCDRAGAVSGEFDQSVQVTGRLRGCTWPVSHAYFTVRGDLLICCNDYYQTVTYGNVRQGSIDELMTSPQAVRLRRRVFGIDDAPAQYVCRSCHDQMLDFPHRQFRPPATFRLG